jgi:hypothetical protein
MGRTPFTRAFSSEESNVAKHKAASGETKKVAKAKAKALPIGEDKAAAAKGKAKSGDRAMTGVEIGHVAGEVWAALEKGEQSIAGLKKAVGAPADMVLAAVGWLAREDKLEFRTSGATVKIALRYRD